MTTLNDVHCHFFSTPFFAPLGGDAAITGLGWTPPGTAEALADRWVAELDRHDIRRAALIASVPGDASSVAAAVARHPARFVGFFMVDPTRSDAVPTTAAALRSPRHRCAADDVSVSVDARVRDWRCAGAADLRARGLGAGHGRVRALRRPHGWGSQEARPGEPVRPERRQSGRAAAGGDALPERADHRAAFRR